MPTVLLIDDSPQIGALLRQIPRLYADWQLLIASDGPRGIEVFREHLPRIDAILLDVLMPGMDGYWTCFMLRALSATVAIIPYTGAACDERLFEQFACVAPVIKPIALDELLHKIRAAIAEAATGHPMEHSPLVGFVQRHAAKMERQLSGLPERQQRIREALHDLPHQQGITLRRFGCNSDHRAGATRPARIAAHLQSSDSPDQILKTRCIIQRVFSRRTVQRETPHSRSIATA